ncbi:MAG: hypothetical protein A3E84_02175 [Gammaproteobacteria bacterium RIFCSPHIGHO2_12_FULL_42_13]|nr:MAG: hypothetical protein A3E84_02175 [Gammaproteobacteria bacterium RIFCSPHIGHO2_12_FULL_42_13]
MCYTFFNEFLWVFFFLCLFGLVGGAFIFPFRRQLLYPIFATPLSGLLVTAVGIATLYGFLGLSLGLSGVITLTSGAVLTIIVLLINKPSHIEKHTLLWVFIFLWVFLMIFLVNATSIHFGGRGFLFMDGSDQLGYAQLADWINAHLASHPPTLSQEKPYESWPNAMFSFDARFGSFYLLALISWIEHQSGMFSYDSATTVVLISGILGVAAVFSRDKKTFFLLVIGLMISQWYPLSRSGYLGKILCYPTLFFLLGLFFATCQDKQRGFFSLSTLVIFMIAAATVYPGRGIALLFFIPAGLYCFSECLFNRKILATNKKSIEEMASVLLILAMLILLAIGVSGSLSRPANLAVNNIPQQSVHWPILWQQLFEIRTIPGRTPFPPHMDAWVFGLSLLLILIASLIAIKKRNALSVSLLLGFPLFCVLLWFLGQNWIAFQLIGIPYPSVLIGMSVLYGVSLPRKHRKLTVILLAMIVVTVLIRIPKYLSSVERYTGAEVIPTLEYSQSEINTLAQHIGNQPVIVTMNDVMYALPILVEFGRRDMKLEWTPAAWKAIVGYQPWPAPKIKPASLYLIDWKDTKSGCALIYRTRQYQLVRC